MILEAACCRTVERLGPSVSDPARVPRCSKACTEVERMTEVDDGTRSPDGTVGNRPRSDADQQIGLFWRIAIVFAGATLIWLLIVYVNQTVFGPEYDRTGHVVNAVLASLLTVPLVVLARRILDKRPLAGHGLPSLRTGWRSFLLGMGCYLFPAGIGLAAVLALGWVEISVETTPADLLSGLAGLMVLVLLYEALPEELIFRGYVYRNLNVSFPRWSAVAGQAVLFTLWGVAIGAASAIERVTIFFFMAAVIGMIRAITGDVWACIGFHLAFQTVQQLFAGQWVGDPFAVSNPGTLAMIAFGLVPLSLAVLTLELVVRKETDWQARDPDPV